MWTHQSIDTVYFQSSLMWRIMELLLRLNYSVAVNTVGHGRHVEIISLIARWSTHYLLVLLCLLAPNLLKSMSKLFQQSVYNFFRLWILVFLHHQVWEMFPNLVWRPHWYWCVVLVWITFLTYTITITFFFHRVWEVCINKAFQKHYCQILDYTVEYSIYYLQIHECL